jgi:hypothetical protein
MPTEHDTDASTRLAHTRQEIDKWLQDHAQTAQAETASLATVSPNVLAGLALIAVAEHVLKRSAKIPTDTSALSNVQQAKHVLQASTRKHPGWMLGLAAAIGAGLAASRPWRGLAKKDTWMKFIAQLLITGATHALRNQALKKEPPTSGPE